MKLRIIILFIFQYNCLHSQMLTSLYFEKNSDILNNKSLQKLDSLTHLKSNLIFRIFGNCDPSGTSDYNKKLSEKRALNVTNYLENRVGKNIKIGSSIGLGINKQINDNSSEELRKKNRRVDIFIEKEIVKGDKINRKRLLNFLDTPVSKMSVKDTFALPDVNFIGGRHFWLPQAETQLEKLVKILESHPNLNIELQGHICCDYENFDGEDLDLKTFNLSETRATSIRNYLVKKGISEKRIQVKALGHLNPMIYPELTEADRTTNRRVEIMIFKK